MINDQIHAPAFQKISDYIWSEDWANDYEHSVIRDHNPNLKRINAKNFNEVSSGSGVLYVGINHILEDVLKSIPKTGKYIVIHRTNDRPFTGTMVDATPPSVKHIYTVDCRGKWKNVTAIPFGVSSINGEDEILKQVYSTEYFIKPPSRIFACYNINRDTFHRNESIPFVESSDLVTYIKPYIGQDAFHIQCKIHEFTLALAGCGADASRQWTSMMLGSIPIVTDCPEMRHFEDMPLVFCPPFRKITNEWLDRAKLYVKGELTKYGSVKTTKRLHMSYWVNHINEMKRTYEI